MTDSRIHLIDADTEQIFPAAPQGAVQLSSAANGWRGILVEHHCIPSMEMSEHYVQGHRLIVHIGKPIEYEWRDDSRWRSKVLQPGAFCLQSHGEINLPRWHDTFEFLAIALDPAFLAHSFQDMGLSGAIRFQVRRAAFDPVITQFARRFKTEIESGSYCGALYGESLAIAFSLHLLERHSQHPKSISQPKGKLTSIQLWELIELIHINLSDELSLSDLAAHLNLSPFHFARLFKSSLGLSPHQYVLQNRIERAKKLISGSTSSGLSLADIAVQVGFYDQTHFGKSLQASRGRFTQGFF